MTRMTVPSRMREEADNVLQFRRDGKRAPLCAQCRIPMLMRGEPDLDETSMIWTYQCAQCRLIERVASVRE